MKRVFLLGYPLGHSLSPAMHNAAFQNLGLDWRYELLEIPPAHIADALARVRGDDCAGANVTIPHKQAVIPFLDQLTEHALQVGAVNTLVKREGKLVGDNTDVYGLVQALRDESVELRDARVVILGAGGAARAAVFALAEAGAASITIWNRTASRAEALAGDAQKFFPRVAFAVNAARAFADATLIVNATSVGMSPRGDASPMPTPFPRGAVAFDMVYRPPQTKFLRDAERDGARALGGIGMLVHQGALALELWAGQRAPVETMRETVECELRST